MQVEWLTPLVSASGDVFSKMLSCDLVYLPDQSKPAYHAEHEVSGCIGLSGACRGVVVVSLGRDTAISVAEILLGERPEQLNSDVTDAVGELTNMIAGAAKTLLKKDDLNVGLPTVVLGKNHSFSFPSRSIPACLLFESSIGPVQVEFGIVEASNR
jgi:chemotaxis protein CheX